VRGRQPGLALSDKSLPGSWSLAIAEAAASARGQAWPKSRVLSLQQLWSGDGRHAGFCQRRTSQAPRVQGHSQSLDETSSSPIHWCILQDAMSVFWDEMQNTLHALGATPQQEILFKEGIKWVFSFNTSFGRDFLRKLAAWAQQNQVAGVEGGNAGESIPLNWEALIEELESLSRAVLHWHGGLQLLVTILQ